MLHFLIAVVNFCILDNDRDNCRLLWTPWCSSRYLTWSTDATSTSTFFYRQQRYFSNISHSGKTGFCLSGKLKLHTFDTAWIHEFCRRIGSQLLANANHQSAALMMFTPVAGHHASCACGGAEQLTEQMSRRGG